MTESVALPTDSRSLLAYTDTQWRAFVGFVDVLDDSVWEWPTDAAGWSVKDHVAHVVRWDESLVALVRDGVPRKESLKISEEARTAGGYDMMNEEIRQQTIRDPVESIKLQRDASWREVRSLIASYSDEDLQKPGADFGLNWPGNESFLETLVDDLGVHYDQHLSYIRAIVEGKDS